MAYWLMKSEPDAFSIDDLERVGTEPWDGIRNYQVRNMIRDEMKPGDRAFFYHSNTKVPGIVGIMDIVSEARPDPTAFDPDEKYYDPKSDPDKPRWLLVDVKYVRHTKRVIPLPELKADPALEEMPLVRRGNRLSIMPVSEDQWEHILSLEDQG
ncbi:MULTISPECIES: EVE domain-containing protein [unclassified Guyparkeria]|uniref:EVE domain-containing protein n=1 Tax=unclassified Guyparkeria TaxID=2626246 RepID=UPI0007334DF4|nr:MULTISPECIES: EVE domain-containing protein [unclassified Guyparkeria]KTG16457.1 EVE domain-containing protein [Guyparkeria sp. XI15]OAE85397.1 EVE domain-containing protein [Guyparkeria sp. WRN-7]